jgi:uncharacterized protein YegL
VKQATELIKEGEARRSFAFYAVGVENADIDKLKSISVRPTLKLKALKFVDLFRWLSTSMQAVVHNRDADPISKLPKDAVVR